MNKSAWACRFIDLTVVKRALLIIAVGFLLFRRDADAAQGNASRVLIAPAYVMLPGVAILSPGLTSEKVEATVPALLGKPSLPWVYRPGASLFRDSARGHLDAYGPAYAIGVPEGIAVVPRKGAASGTFTPFVPYGEDGPQLIALSQKLIEKLRGALESEDPSGAQQMLRESFDQLRRNPGVVDVMRPVPRARPGAKEDPTDAMNREILRRLGAVYEARFSAVPGVLDVEVAPAAPFDGSIDPVGVYVQFDSYRSFHSAERRGLLPETLPGAETEAATGIQLRVWVAKLSMKVVRDAAAAVVAHWGKGGPNARFKRERAARYRSLKSRGATPYQLEWFEGMCTPFSASGGRAFNPALKEG